MARQVVWLAKWLDCTENLCSVALAKETVDVSSSRWKKKGLGYPIL